METVIDKTKVEKYSSYKNSGAEWLGDIPMHWNTLSNKNIFKLKKNQVGKKSGDYVLLSLTLNGVIKRDMENPQGKFPAEFNTYQEVKKGDFIFCLFDVEETPRCVGLSDFDGMITGAYTVMEPNDNFDRNFFYYFYLNLDADKRLKPLYTGLRNTISKENFFSFKSFVPPKEEQTAIAAYLDRKTALIDQAIDIKQKQIELLKERRQILIYKAVTRGLNPNVKLKDSGVEWIGEIPEGWEILPGFRVYKENKTNNIGMKEKVVLSLSYGNIVIKPEEKLVGLVPESFETYQTVKPGDIIIRCMDLQNDKTSLRTGIAVNNGIITSAYLNLNIINGNNSNYMYNFLHSLDTTKVLYKFGTGLRQNLNYSDFKRMPIIVPPIVEQKAIVEFIEKLKNKIATAISLKEQEIEKLKEYKATLINSAVTGKIKVC
jgi:type I restriction enzyme S subunit